MRCFISTSNRADTTRIREILRNNKIQPLDFENSVEYGTALPKILRRQIKDCDFVIALYDGNPNVAYEVGLATGLNKPIILFVKEGFRIDSRFLFSEYVYARLPGNDFEIINHNLKVFLERMPFLRKSPFAASMPYEIVSEKPPKKLVNKHNYQEFLEDLAKAGPKQFEMLVGELLRTIKAGILVANTGKDQAFFADYSLWVEKLNTIGNPILVEAKNSSDETLLRKQIEHLSNHLMLYNQKSALLIYNRPHGQSYEELSVASPLVLSISFQDLVHRLSNETFVQILRQLRNATLHAAAK